MITDEQRFEAMQKELGFLRSEMDLNRKYIFERPLLIVAGGITAAATLEELIGFEVLPLLFIVLMGYNLWFTYNRLQSNARIIAYLQVVYTPDGADRWIGWEAGLLLFRAQPRETRAPKDNRFLRWWRGDLADRPPKVKGQPGNRFYGPILSFHIAAVVLLTGFLLAQSDLVGKPVDAFASLQGAALALTGITLIGFFVLAWLLRPGEVRHTIDESRRVWERILPPSSREAATG
jgi:hypothetical protein